MIEDYNEPVYNILSELVSLKFKSQIKDSGIAFEKILKMTNLLTNKETFVLVTNSKSIYFTNKEEFVNGFITLLKENIKDFNNQYENLRNSERNDIFVDENEVYNRDEYIGHCGSKQLKLLKKMYEYVKV